MSQVRRSIALSALDSYLGLVLQIASTMIVSRVLTPEQVGTFAVAAVFAALASTLRDFGVAEYLIQHREPGERQIRAALAVNIGISWGMALLLFAAAPVLAWVYRQPEIANVLRVLAFSFVLIPFGAVAMAWHRRQMNFRPMLIAGLSANLTSFAVVVALVLNGVGTMSLAWASLAGVVVTVAVSTMLRPPNFPRWPALAGVGEVFRFGRHASGVYIFGQLGRGAPEMVLGYLLGMAPVGLFSRAWALVEIFNRLVVRALQPVYMPYFARALREKGESRGAMRQAVAALSGVGFTFFGLMALAAEPAIRLMYGGQWLAAVPLAQVLCVAGAIELVYLPAKEALLAHGLARESNRLQLAIQGLRVLGLTPAAVWGLPGACWGLLVAALAGAWLSHRALVRHTQWTSHELRVAALPSLLLAGLALAPFAMWLLVKPTSPGVSLLDGALGAGMTLTAWTTGALMLAHPLRAELHRVGAALGRAWNRK